MALGTESVQGNLRERVIAKGSFGSSKNEEMYEKYFRLIRPKDRLFLELSKLYRFSDHSFCDAGCGYGTHLVHCPGGYGIELDTMRSDFAQSLGLTVFKRDLIQDDLTDLPTVEIVWCSATIEHLDSPHILLRKLNGLLVANGLLVLEAPVLPPIEWFGYLPIPKLRKLFLEDHGDHVNAFTPATLRYACERAGFKTIDLFRWSLPLMNRYPRMPIRLTGMPPFNFIARGSCYVGSKIDGWDYPPKSMRRAAMNTRGYESKF